MFKLSHNEAENARILIFAFEPEFHRERIRFVFKFLSLFRVYL